MKIISHAFDRSLGDRDFDVILFSHFAAQFKEEYSIDVYSDAKAQPRALQFAMLSPIYRVREYEVQDSLPFSLGLLSDEGAGSDGILFPKGQPIPSVKVLTFQRRDLFHLEAFNANPDELPPGTSPNISRFTIGPFKGSHFDKTCKTFASEKDVQDINRSLQETQEWLDELGDKEDELAFTTKLEGIKKPVSPIQLRYDEDDKRILARGEVLKYSISDS